MAYTAAAVGSGPRHRIVGAQKETVTDFTITVYTAAGEPITPTDLGLSTVDNADARVQTGVATNTGVEATIVSPLRIKVNLATGADAVVASGTVVRVTARGA